MKLTDLKDIVVICTAIVGGIIILVALIWFVMAFFSPDDWEVLGKAWDSIVTQVLFPMFNTLVAASLTYIFGKQIVDALSDRLRGSSGSGAPGR